MAAEWSKGFWSTAPRSRLYPSWKSCTSTLNSWARWEHLSPLCVSPFCVSICDWLLLLSFVFACLLHVWTFHIFFRLSLFLCSCDLLSGKCKDECNCTVSCHYIWRVCDYLNIHPAPSLIPSRNIKAFHWRWHPKHIIQCPAMHCSRSEQFASLSRMSLCSLPLSLFFLFLSFFCKQSDLTFRWLSNTQLLQAFS